MFFKRIEMVGFKSFANKTEVIFKPGVTVIVGPNGCGKSNIFDAVRWVLGEQRAKSLRGGKMNDIIFSGSATHRATAFAQVTLTVSNEDGRLPVEYKEVTVGRRLMRTGESEYSINRHVCRLRDVLELFMDTGVGTNAYSIMEQGRIDQIINARPIDRREIFEEAAGVSKYRTRRQEAQRRLGRTEDDLIRLADIIAEVKRQATSLKRQANRAERYKRLSAELEVLEKRLLAYRWRTQRESGKGLRTDFETSQKSLAEVSEKLAGLEQKQEKEADRSEELSREILQLTAQINDKSSDIHRAEKRVSLLRQQNEFNANRALVLSQEVQENTRTLEEAKRNLERAESEYSEREAQYEDRKAVQAVRQAEYDKISQGLDQRERELAQVRIDLANQRNIQNTLENRINLAAALGEQLAGDIEGLEQQEAEAKAQSDTATQRVEERSGAHAEQEAAIQESVKRHEGLADRLNDLEEEESEVREAVKDTEQNWQHVKSRLAALLDLQRSHEGYREGVRKILQAAEADELKGIEGTVASLVKPKHGHELAVEAALSSGEQIIVTTSVKDRDGALEWLRSKGDGRATLIAQGESIAAPSRTESLADGKEGIAWLDTLVEYEEKHAAAVKHLLGRALLVKDLNAALKISKGTDLCCVTAEGEVAIGGIQVTGGKLESSGLLTREREINELQERGERLEKEFESLKKRQESLVNARQVVEVERREVEAKRQHQEIEMAGLKRDLDTAKRDQRLAQDSLERLQKRISELKRQSEEHLDERANASEQLDEVRAEVNNLEEKSKEMEGERATTSAEVRRLEEEVQALAVEVVGARESLHTLRIKRDGFQMQCADLEHRLQGARNEIANLDQQNSGATTEIIELDKALETLAEERHALELKETEQRGASDVINIEVKRLAQEVHVMTRERNELQNRVHDLDMKRAQQEMQLQHCDEEAQEKFNMAMADILAANPEEEIEDPDELRSEASELRQRLSAMGPVNVIAIEEYEQLKEREGFLSTQETDLLEAKKDLEQTIEELDKTSTRIFTESFNQIRQNFQNVFRRLFAGGRADLVALDPENLIESGVDIIAQPPGKKLQSISLLSGGEKALTAIALLFGIFQQKPAPFCVLDEIDAPLDDKNVNRFKDMLQEFCSTTQFIIITHNKLTMQLADALFGITMEEPGVSRLVGVDIRTAEKFAA